uniref:Peptide transporter PTR2 n=1 Tax=Aegilops tauschii subsp. strangulata TaxID=200361 RepID=A0A453HGH0_AEGTS
MPQAQYHRARRRPVPARRRGSGRRWREAALQLLQRGLLQLLRGRDGGAHRARLGADTLRDGRRFRGLCRCHGGRPCQPRRRRRLLPEQATAGQHLHAHSKVVTYSPFWWDKLTRASGTSFEWVTKTAAHISYWKVFLDKACVKAQDGGSKESGWGLCTAAEVEQVKVLLCVVPIFACTIVFNTILAQLQTFSVQQGSAMDTRLAANFHAPPASLQAIPYIMLIVFVPAYEAVFVPAVRRLTGVGTGITPLQRIGVGLFAVTFSMVAAALVEARRRHSSVSGDGRTLSIFWIAPQFLVFGLSEMFTAVGLIEFFYKQSLSGMQAFLTSMTYCSYSFGFYLSSVLVSLVNRVTSRNGGNGWLSNNDLDKDRLDLFYWLLAALSILNFFNFLFWSRWYSNSVETVQVAGVGGDGGSEQEDEKGSA